MLASGPNHAHRRNRGLYRFPKTRRHAYLYGNRDLSGHDEYLEFTEADGVDLSNMTVALDEVIGARFERVSDRVHGMDY